MAAMMDEMEEGQELPMVKIGDASVAGTSIQPIHSSKFLEHSTTPPSPRRTCSMGDAVDSSSEAALSSALTRLYICGPCLCVPAPFTSKMPSIRGVVDIIRQGRCTLVRGPSIS